MCTHYTILSFNVLALSVIVGMGFGFTSSPARAAVQITIDKDIQQMTVAVNGEPLYTWPVSSGVPAHETPNGTFKAFRMEEDHYSREWDDAPMPHSIFFTKVGHAIHGTDFARKLGSPASHGCVRLSRENAATLYALVEEEGVLNTTVTLTGSSQVALARGLKPQNDAVVARGTASRSYNSTDVYVDRYGRPLPARPSTGYTANLYGSDRRIYETLPQYPTYDERGMHSQSYYRQLPPPPRTQYFYNNR